MKIRLLASIIIVAMAVCTGCELIDPDVNIFDSSNRFIDPSKTIERPDSALVNPISMNVSDLDKTSELYPNAVQPSEQDWIYPDVDYRLGPTDIMDVEILGLYGASEMNMPTLLRREVSDSGLVDLPQLKARIKAEGLTKMELTDAIKKAYKDAGILNDAEISITIVARRQQTFNVLGAVMRAGTYNLVRRDMRLMEAIAVAGGISQSNIPYIYVIRQASAIRRSDVIKGAAKAQETKPAPAAPKAKPAVVTPKAAPEAGGEKKEISDLLQSAMFTDATQDAVGSSDLVRKTPKGPGPEQRYKWKYNQKTSRWEKVSASQQPAAVRRVPVQPAPATKVTTAPAKEVVPHKTAPRKTPAGQPLKWDMTRPKTPKASADALQPRSRPSADDPYGWGKVARDDLVRVIAINLKKLRQGDYRMNIVIRENDVIQVPMLEVGEFYVSGEVLRPGVYSLTGRDITIKQAVAAAGNLGPLAWPANSVLVRRIGKNQEQMIPINIEKIMRGHDPDLYLKPNDMISVGTHWSASFLAVIRNAFRMTYGFGFIYDRNFAEPLVDGTKPNSDRFTRW